MTELRPLPPTFAATRDALHEVACYVVAPARKARDGRIGLRPTSGGFGTPVLADGTRIVVRAARVCRDEQDAGVPITTLQSAAAHLGIELSADPGVGRDLPPYEPVTVLEVDHDAAAVLAEWYAFGQAAIDGLRDAAGSARVWSEAQLWPEHFDLATEVGLGNERRANVGFSPGDGYHAAPYVYVGPHDMTGLDGGYWNAPFGAVLGYDGLLGSAQPGQAATTFIERGLGLLAAT
jgi:hypothetical protein